MCAWELNLLTEKICTAVLINLMLKIDTGQES